MLQCCAREWRFDLYYSAGLGRLSRPLRTADSTVDFLDLDPDLAQLKTTLSRIFVQAYSLVFWYTE